MAAAGAPAIYIYLLKLILLKNLYIKFVCFHHEGDLNTHVHVLLDQRVMPGTFWEEGGGGGCLFAHKKSGGNLRTKKAKIVCCCVFFLLIFQLYIPITLMNTKEVVLNRMVATKGSSLWLLLSYIIYLYNFCFMYLLCKHLLVFL